MHSLFGGDFNVAVFLIWQFGAFASVYQILITSYSFIAIICIAATTFCLIKVMSATIIDQLTKCLTRQ